MTGTSEITQMTDTNTIEKEILLRAPRSRVWRALADSQEFGSWFGIKLDGAFEAGRAIRGKLSNPKYAHLDFEFVVERMEPEDTFSYRWHPFAMDPNIDYSQEPTTLVEFHLTDTDGGTMLTVNESGFDNIPQHRRDEAFRMNGKGWASQVENIRRYVES